MKSSAMKLNSLGFASWCAAAIAISLVSAAIAARPVANFTGENVFNRISTKATEQKWRALPIGEVVGKVAKELEGTPYVANTLELYDDHEVCSVNMTELDCVTFFETALDLARTIKKGGNLPKYLFREVEFTRYRGGMLDDYTSRLHYTTDWFFDNEKKHVVRILSDLPGSVPFTNKVSLMSEHPENIKQLKSNPELVSKIAKQEAAINARSMKYVPLDKIAAIEPLLKTGDIVGITTSHPGLDIAHTGLIYRTADGVAHFMDASSKKASMRVVIEPGSISQALSKGPKSWTGAMFARPLEPPVIQAVTRTSR
jgi:hypothetical protein